MDKFFVLRQIIAKKQDIKTNVYCIDLSKLFDKISWMPILMKGDTQKQIITMRAGSENQMTFQLKASEFEEC